MSDTWTFGWTQLLTIIGFVITIAIALGGFRTFGRWKKERVEEKRIEAAIEALELVYECKFIFDRIRSDMTFPYEWEDMPNSYGSEEQRRARGPFYAILKRVVANKDIFMRAWKVQARCSALFGTEVEEIFLLMQRAGREIEVSAEMLLSDPEPTVKSQDNLEIWDSWRANVWSGYAKQAKGGDRVGEKLSEFKTKMENLCRPVIDREYGKVLRQGIARRLADWIGMS